MIAGISVVFFLAVGTSIGVWAEDPTYLVYFPRYVRPGFQIQMVAEILKNPNPVDFTAKLNSPADEINFVLEATLTQGASKLLTFDDVIPIGYDGTNDFVMNVTGVDTVTKEIVFHNSSDLEYKSKALSIFIQTDKGIYKPAQTIKFRAVVTTPDLLAHEGKVTYKLTDPDSNIVFQKKDADLINGVAGSQFALGRYSTLGDWKLTYRVGNEEESVTVTVEEYALPKFEVKVTTNQSFLHSGSEKLSGTISAEFTFGQPVKGTAKLTLRNGQRSWILPYELPIFAKFDGEQAFSVNLQDFQSKLQLGSFYGQPLELMAEVTDKNSKVKLEGSTSVNCYGFQYKVDTIYKPETIKPGLQYTAYMKVTEQDGKLLSEEERENFGLRITPTYIYRSPEYLTKEQSPESVVIQSDGLAVFQYATKLDNFREVTFEIKSEKYPDQWWGSWRATRFDSPSGIYIQMSSVETAVKPGKSTTLSVQTNNARDKTYSVTMMARGNIVHQETYTPTEFTEEENNVYKFDYSFMVMKDMAPNIAVVFLAMGAKGEIIADSISLRVEYSLSNPVSIETSVQRTETGKPVDITVYASANSFIALRAIDRSVILQKEGNDITTDDILQDLDEYGVAQSKRPWWFFYSWNMDGSNAKEVFQKSGITVFTDGATFISQTASLTVVLEDSFFEDDEIMFAMAEDARPVLQFDGGESGQILRKEPIQPKTRKEFPETWIWIEDNAGNAGEKIFSYVLPDTATTWEISAFAISDLTGLGVAEPNSQIIATRDFFISLNLPATMVSGEVLNMRTTVYNFFPTDLKATVTLEESDWYELNITGNKTNATGSTREIEIPSRDGYTTVFSIRLLKPGMAKIKVTAYSELAADAVERVLPVKPEGVENDFSQSYLVERSDVSEEETTITFPIKIPENAVSGSAYGKVSVSGNVLGSSMNNLGNLLKMPGGCGEQTMLNFAPDVYVSLYLKEIGLLTGKIAEKSRRHIQAGYQNELRYQHEDGSFSAFQGDENGSTWLSAFVAKCFIAAMELSSDLVQSEKIERTIKFLLTKQTKDGSFKEDGFIRHKDMQGGINSDETMTAFVLVSLTEGQFSTTELDISASVRLAREYLESKVDTLDDTFTLAVVAYALALSDSGAASAVMTKLESRAVNIRNLKFWQKGEEKEPKCDGDKFAFMDYCVPPATSSDIEVTSYILLTLIKLERKNDMMSIVRWLATQRSNLGGYRSTQDTVMAIQALSTVAGIFSDREIDLTLSVSHTSNATLGAPLKVTKENSMLLQSIELPGLTGSAIVVARGIGFADVQLAYQYNTIISDPKNDPFAVRVDAKKVNGLDKMELVICSSINKKRENPINRTGMFVVAVKMPSGYTVNDKQASASNKKAKLVELVDDELTGYFDELPPDDELCLTMNLDRFAKVADVKPQMLRVMDYYSPEIKSVVMYKTPASDATPCEVCGVECSGCPAASAEKITISLFVSLVLTIFTTVVLQEH